MFFKYTEKKKLRKDPSTNNSFFTNFNDNILNYIILGSIVGALIFLYYYGFKVLDFTYDQWLFNSGDLTQHYIGWSFFRDSPWQFPLGLMNNYAHPFGVAITYTDSIPLFAIFFKVFSRILPKHFQYFGLYQLISFMLQGVFSTLIVRRYFKNIFVSLSAASLITVSPILLKRVFVHTALASHWIILLSLTIWAYRYKFKKLKHKILIWSFINSLAVLIHPYFIPMTLSIMLATLLADSLQLKSLKTTFITTITSLLSILTVFWVIGGFTGESLEGVGLGKFSMNINAFFDSDGWSKFLKDLPTAFSEQYEGFQYLGLGIIILIPIVAILFLHNIFSKKESVSHWFKSYYSLLIAIIPLTIISLSLNIAFNEKILFQYRLPEKIEEILSIFRSTGRLFWPVTYIFVLFLIIYFAKNIKKASIITLSFLLLTIIQVIDISPFMNTKMDLYKHQQSFNNILKSEFWNEVGKEFKHIITLPATEATYSYFSRLATDNNMTLNTGSFARGPYNLLEEDATRISNELINGIYSTDTIYIIQNLNLLKNIMMNDLNKNFVVAKVDNTDNCYALFHKNVSFDFNAYDEIPIFTADNFNKISLDEYIDTLKLLPENIAIILSTKGDSSSALNNDVLNKLNELGLFKESINYSKPYAYSALKITGENPFLIESITSSKAILKYAKNSKLANLNVPRAITIVGSCLKDDSVSIASLNGFQHSFNDDGINFLIYDIEKDTVLNISSFNSYDNITYSMDWNLN